MPNIPNEFFSTFNKVKYHDEPHKYYVDDKQLISVTTLLHEYQEPFDEKYWLEVKSNELNISISDLKITWDFLNKYGTTKGSIVHDYAENLFLNKYFPYPKKKIEEFLNGHEIYNVVKKNNLINNYLESSGVTLKKKGHDIIYDGFLKTKKHIDNFYNTSFGKLIPIRTEFVIFDIFYGIGGMVDLLVFNKKSGKFEIWDYKTNKEYNHESKYGNYLKGPLFMLPDCEHTIYSLQLSTYRYLIEKNTGIELGDSYLVWVSENNENFQIFKAEDYRNYSEELLNLNKIHGSKH